MKLKIFFIVLVSLIYTPSWADIQIDMMNDKINRLDRELTILQKRIYQNPTAVLSRTSEKSTDSSLDDLYTQLADQNRVIQELTEKIDFLERRADLAEERLTLIQDDVDVRFKNLLEQKTSVPKENEKKDVKHTPKEMYDTALALLKKGQYEKAEITFLEFMKKNPDSELVGNANYWLGETYYVRGRYEQAAGIFADGLSKYKSNPKAPDNMLKLGLTLKRLKQNEASCTAFQNLAKEFPKASQNLKDRAKEEAEKLACP